MVKNISDTLYYYCFFYAHNTIIMEIHFLFVPLGTIFPFWYLYNIHNIHVDAIYYLELIITTTKTSENTFQLYERTTSFVPSYLHSSIIPFVVIPFERSFVVFVVPPCCIHSLSFSIRSFISVETMTFTD